MNNFKYNKTYYEIYALLSMELLRPDFSVNFFKGESPDWQNEVDKIGLEVARAENKHLGFTKNLNNIYLGTRKVDIPQHVIDNFQGQLVFENGRLFAISDSIGLVNGTRHIELAVEALKTKTQLLNKQHFKIFNKNYLYLFLTNTALDTDIALFYDKCCQCQKKYIRNYDSIILFDNNYLHLVELPNRRQCKLEIKDRNLSALKLQAQRLYNLDFWPDGTSFISVKQKL